MDHLKSLRSQKKHIKFGSDTCKWESFFSKNEFKNGDIKHYSQSNFYYYHKKSKRSFTIVLGESKISREELRLNFACFYKQSIESFTPLD